MAVAREFHTVSLSPDTSQRSSYGRWSDNAMMRYSVLFFCKSSIAQKEKSVKYFFRIR